MSFESDVSNKGGSNNKNASFIAFILFVATLAAGIFLFGKEEIYMKVYCGNTEDGCSMRMAQPFESIGFECSRTKNLCVVKEVQSGNVLKEIKLSEIEKAKAMDEHDVEKIRSKMDSSHRRAFDKWRVIIPNASASMNISSRNQDYYSIYLLTKENKKMYGIFVNQDRHFVTKQEKLINSYLQSSQEKLNIQDVEKIFGLKLAAIMLILASILGLLRIMGAIGIEKKMTYNDIGIIFISLFFATVFYCAMPPAAAGFTKIFLHLFCLGAYLITLGALFGKVKAMEELPPEEREHQERVIDSWEKFLRKLTGM